MNPTVKGSLKSKAMWLAATVSVIGVLEANQTALLVYVSPHWQGLATVAIGVAIAVVRAWTSQSLLEKGLSKSDDTDQAGA
jgi:hypothetical protein